MFHRICWMEGSKIYKQTKWYKLTNWKFSNIYKIFRYFMVLLGFYLTVFLTCNCNWRDENSESEWFNFKCNPLRFSLSLPVPTPSPSCPSRTWFQLYFSFYLILFFNQYKLDLARKIKSRNGFSFDDFSHDLSVFFKTMNRQNKLNVGALNEINISLILVRMIHCRKIV